MPQNYTFPIKYANKNYTFPISNYTLPQESPTPNPQAIPFISTWLAELGIKVPFYRVFTI
jgi:hypothetical protein